LQVSNVFGRQVVVVLTNKSGGSVIAGDVVVIDTANNGAFTTTTTGAFTGAVGIAQESIANNASGRVLLSGYAALVNVNASVTRGNYGKTHTVAKQATDAGASRIQGTFCQFLTGGTTPTAIVYPVDLAGTSLSDPTTTRGDLITRDASALARLALGTAAYGLVSNGTDPVWAEILPWHISILPQVVTADATTGSWALQGFTEQLNYYFYAPGSAANSGAAIALISAAQNDAIAWDLVLAKGTWDAHFYVRKSTNTGIITLNQDGVSQGTVDTYAAAAATAKVSITGWTVASTGKKRMQILMATKNASSSGYLGELFAIEFRRTA
jgi:hypothetical protein